METPDATSGRPPGRWTPVEPPDAVGGVTFRAVADAVAGPVVVGDGGIVLRAGDDGFETGNEWLWRRDHEGRQRGVPWQSSDAAGRRTIGPSLRCADATADGECVWVAGSDGTLAAIDVRPGRLRDHSRPRGYAPTFRSLAVAGPAGSEELLVVDAGGRLLHGTVRENWVRWAEPGEPGGSDESGESGEHGDSRSVRAAGVAADGRWVAADAGGIVHAATRPDRWRRIGAPCGGRQLHDVAADDGRVLVGGDGGLLAEHRDGVWHTDEVGTRAISTVTTGASLAIALAEDGRLFHRDGTMTDGGDNWSSAIADPSETLWDACLGARPLVVGTNATVLEYHVEPTDPPAGADHPVRSTRERRP